MKKFLYGIIVLLGIGFISTNFIVDTNTVDHKIVKAGGTACKWISDTGYGTGPIYFNCAPLSGYIYDIYDEFLNECLSFIKCDSHNEGQALKNGIVYDKNMTPLNGDKRMNRQANGNSEKYTFQNGIVIKYSSLGSNTSQTVNYQYVLTQSYAVKDMDVSNYSNSIGSSSRTYTVFRELQPSEYTCVCAEY